MKILQISTVVEGKQRYVPQTKYSINDNATIYGLGDDQKVYFWGVVSSRKVPLPEMDEDGNTFETHKTWGWKAYQP